VSVAAARHLHQPGHLGTTEDRHVELGDPFAHDPLDVALPQGQPIRVARREVAEVEGDLAATHGLHHLPGGEEPLDDAALVEHLDRAGDPGQRQLGPSAVAVERRTSHDLESSRAGGLHANPIGAPPTITTACARVPSAVPFDTVHHSTLPLSRPRRVLGRVMLSDQP